MRRGRRVPACTHIYQHGVGEARPHTAVVAADACRVAPAGVEAVVLDRLPVRQAGQALEDITTATTGGGTERRPLSEKSSEENWSGKSLSRSRRSTE